MQRYFSNIKKDNFLILSDNDLYHIKTVMRMKENDLIEVVYNHLLHICMLDNNYHAIIKETIKETTEKNFKVILCVPLLQEQKMSFVLQKATELGVDEIVPILTSSSIVKIDGKEDKKIKRWNLICKEASEQSKRLEIPKISNIKKIMDLTFDGLKIVCSTKEQNTTIKKVLKNNLNYDTIVFVVGPEGGLTNEEEETLKELSFVPVTLGNNIMRVETVPIYLISVLNYEMME